MAVASVQAAPDNKLMEFGVKHFLWINGVLIGILVFSMLVRRRGTANPSKLNLRAGGSRQPVPTKASSSPKASAKWSSFSRATGARGSSARSKSLNVIFNYNGHSWDAYEVLGVPAGSSLPAVQRAYQEELAKVDGGSKAFIETAYQAILKTNHASSS